MKRQTLVILLLVPVLGVSLSCGKRGRGDGLPAPSEIASISATTETALDDSANAESKGRVTFQVPKQHWEALLKSFEPYEHDPKPAKWPVYGFLEIKLIDGTVKDVMLGPGKFRVNKVYFSGGEMNRQVEVLKAAYKDSQKNATKTGSQ